MGAGKTSVGALVAERSRRRHIDLDRWVQADTGRSIGVLFAELGEDGFRDAEQASLERALELLEPIVLSTGGGVLGRSANRDALVARSHVVWLRATPETAAGRVGDGHGRPLLQGDAPVDVLRRLIEERAPLYEATADLAIDTDDRSAADVADEVHAYLEGRSGDPT
jgi:shikimate kinase